MICEKALLKEAENGCWDIDISELKRILEYVPKVEIIRCKNCKYSVILRGICVAIIPILIMTLSVPIIG